MRVAARGKSFLVDDSQFRFRGLRWPVGLQTRTSGPRSDGEPELTHAALVDAGYTVVSLPPPPRTAIEPAAASGLRYLLEFEAPRPDDLATLSRRERRCLVRDMANVIRGSLRAWDGSEALLGMVFRAQRHGARSRQDARIARRVADELAIAMHDEHAGLQAAWWAERPSESECSPEFDFLVVGFELSSQDQLAPALMACHRNVGDRPLVLGPVSLVGAGRDDNPPLRWVIDTALRCGAAGTILEPVWPDDLPRHDAETAREQRRTIRDLDVPWPSVSVVVNAYNAAATIDECLSHCDRLEYARLEVIVVDDGSTDATREIVGTHACARLVMTPHRGLGAGRNVGYHAARGELIAYLDADAYPSPDWPWYIALAALGDGVGGAGGPNVPPPDEPASAKLVARSPGGPVPQLLGPARAEHIPGCNMAFWAHLLERLHGFDPLIEGAEDVEFEWRVADAWDLAFHPAALVWHHRRPGLGPYLRQQRHYGRGQAILERRHPERFPAGYRARKALARLRPRSSGDHGAPSYPVSYVSLPHPDGWPLELAHQWGMPLALIAVCTAPLAILRRRLAAPAALATGFAAALFAIDVFQAGSGWRRAEAGLRPRAGVAAFRMLRPLAFRYGHLSGRRELRRAGSDWPEMPDGRCNQAKPTVA